MSTPKVTVLMAVHNGERYLRRAIDSILCQTFSDFEFLIVNDGSSDGSGDILASYHDPRIRVIENASNIGLTRSLNAGLAAAQGELIARQDADDVSHFNRLYKQVQFMERHPEVAVVGTAGRFIDDKGRPRRSIAQITCTSAIAIRWQLLFEGPFAHSSVMFRKAVVWVSLGGYDERYRISQDFELWSRLGAHEYAMSNLPERLVDLRLHAGSVSSRYTEEGISYVRDVLRNNMVRELGEHDYDRWLDFWVTVNNPRTFGWTRNVEGFLEELAAIRARFVALYPEAASDLEVRRQTGTMIARVSCVIAGENRRAAVAGYTAAMRFAPATAVRIFPRFIAKLVLGWTRRESRETGSA